MPIQPAAPKTCLPVFVCVDVRDELTMTRREVCFKLERVSCGDAVGGACNSGKLVVIIGKVGADLIESYLIRCKFIRVYDERFAVNGCVGVRGRWGGGGD